MTTVLIIDHLSLTDSESFRAVQKMLHEDDLHYEVIFASAPPDGAIRTEFCSVTDGPFEKRKIAAANARAYFEDLLTRLGLTHNQFRAEFDHLEWLFRRGPEVAHGKFAAVNHYDEWICKVLAAFLGRSFIAPETLICVTRNREIDKIITTHAFNTLDHCGGIVVPSNYGALNYRYAGAPPVKISLPGSPADVLERAHAFLDIRRAQCVSF